MTIKTIIPHQSHQYVQYNNGVNIHVYNHRLLNPHSSIILLLTPLSGGIKSVQMVLQISGHSVQVANIKGEYTPGNPYEGEWQESLHIERVLLKFNLVEGRQVHDYQKYYQTYQLNKIINQPQQYPIMYNYITVQNKTNNLIVCPNCSFSPTYSQLQLQSLITFQSVYQIQWICLFCHTKSIANTDNNFGYFCLGRNCKYGIVDRTGGGWDGMRQIEIWVDTGMEMGGEIGWVRGNGLSRKGFQEENKKAIMEESPLLKSYLEGLAADIKSKKGRYFSWQSFAKQRKLTKIEFSLWLCDKIRQKIPNLKVKFYHNNLPQDNIPLNQVLRQEFITKISKTHPYIDPQIHTLNNLQYLPPANPQIILISCQSLTLSTQILGSHPHSLLINMEQSIDPITLTPTSTGNYLHTQLSNNNSINFQSQQQQNKQKNKNKNKHKHVDVDVDIDVQIFDYRLHEDKGISEWIKIVMDMLTGDDVLFTIFGNKKNGSNGQWEKIADQENYRSQLNKQRSPMPRFSLFIDQKSKQTTIITQLLSSILKNSSIPSQTIYQSLQSTINSLSTIFHSTYSQIRLFFRYETNQNGKLIQNTILWKTNSSDYLMDRDISRQVTEYLDDKAPSPYQECQYCRSVGKEEQNLGKLYEQL